MGNIHEIGQDKLKTANGDAEIERLSALVERLQIECESLRQVLAKTEEERGWYLKAVYEGFRTTAREFEDIDLDWLKKNSAGPVELLEEPEYQCFE